MKNTESDYGKARTWMRIAISKHGGIDSEVDVEDFVKWCQRATGIAIDKKIYAIAREVILFGL